MATLAEIEEQIRKLQAEAEKIKKDQFNNAIEKIKALMSEHGITLEDLGASAKKTRKVSEVKAKYRDPVTGKEWSGRGKPPSWMTIQLQAGKQKHEFLI